MYMSLVYEVEQAAGCSNEYIYPISDRYYLLGLRNTAEYYLMLQAYMPAICCKTFVYLYCQFPGGCEYQSTGVAVACSNFIFSKQLQHGYCKSGCFAGTGLGTAQNIFSLQGY